MGTVHVPWRPKTFNQHVLWEMIGPRDERRRQFGDKLAIRSFVETRLGPGVLPQLYAVLEDPREFDLSALPQRFVVKPNHASGMASIVFDKSTVDEARMRQSMASWLAYDYENLSREFIYGGFPRRILIEELIEQAPGKLGYDYKLFCFAGKVRLVHVILDRNPSDFSDRTHAFYDEHWTRLDMSWGAPQGPDLPRPACFDQMTEIAYALSHDFNHLRVDLYVVGDRIVVGELTSFSDAGRKPIQPAERDAWLGSFLAQVRAVLTRARNELDPLLHLLRFAPTGRTVAVPLTEQPARFASLYAIGQWMPSLT